jgi:hypothetical protein
LRLLVGLGFAVGDGVYRYLLYHIPLDLIITNTNKPASVSIAPIYVIYPIRFTAVPLWEQSQLLKLRLLNLLLHYHLILVIR